MVPGKANDSKPKINQKTNQATKIGTGEAHQSFSFRQNRVFGTTRSTNIIQGRPVWDKSITKTKIVVAQRKPKSISTTQAPIDTHDKTSTENVNLGLKKSVAFPQQLAEKTTKNSSQEKVSASVPKTPVASSFRVRSKSSTPFYSALNCSKCHFDRLETSSYWVGQIKMAESVGKHFVASEFFRLALESHAEPIRNLGIELKRYLLRHGYLSEQKEWREVAARYGLH
ncbi:hypothetical protein AAZX31_11G145400 [Glycine max]|uniref:uncharacterized protein LOC114377249 n=1 Tax=Glycine soja TaxID=3848 RepID=UPI0003DEAB88|nr:uncharacterized protein LOC114377249 [Glycine soja]KAG4988692.1 hypothetical protein JHK85_031675 [Glycine max]KAG4994296.1 hypothetical protein JHK86_031123 [Glycine max]KAG5124292.1 hypothetical protein JHK82_031029 [Glycine max]KAG5145709.1 hypothetical protein JHK84_031252 [Glycine max]KAH1224971.1 hypothetical protein GmHk_11G031971 [Glycine max]